MDDTSQKIIDATMSLVRDKGYVATTTKDIAHLAGVNECTLFRKFKNKKNIVLNGVAIRFMMKPPKNTPKIPTVIEFIIEREENVMPIVPPGNALNDIGVLARISGLFSGKSYNLDSLTVGTTEDKSISRIFNISVIDYTPITVLIESVQTEERNNNLIALVEKCFTNRIKIIRGGSVAVEALSIIERQQIIKYFLWAP